MSDDHRDELQFEQAEFEEGQAGAPSACALCQAPLSGSYHAVNGRPACESCANGLQAHFSGGSGFARFVKAVVLGMLGGLVGAVLYWGVARISGYELSLIAIATGWLVGKGISIGNGHRGGKRYQLLAVAMTWCAIAASHVPFLDEAILADEPAATEAGFEQVPSDRERAMGQAESGLAPSEPGETREEGGFASLPTPVRWMIEYPVALALPLLSLTDSPMGFVILLIGLWTAWGTNSKVQLEITGPHELQAAGAVPPLPPGASAPTEPGAPGDGGGALPPTPRE